MGHVEPRQEAVRIQESATGNAQFCGDELAALLHAAGEWLTAHRRTSLVLIALHPSQWRPGDRAGDPEPGQPLGVAVRVVQRLMAPA